MKIIAVSTVKDEADIIGHTIAHLRRQGVDDFRISSPADDPTTEVLWDQHVWTMQPHEPFDQGAEMTRLAEHAAEWGADWIIPFDADEFWCGYNGLTIRDVLLCTKQSVDAIFAPMYLHITPEERVIAPKPLPKVAFRPNPEMVVSWGNHNVTGISSADYGSLVVRELQYRNFPHFLSKIDKARTLHAQPHMASHENGSHMWRLCTMTDDELRTEWERHLATPTLIDPIPGLCT